MARTLYRTCIEALEVEDGDIKFTFEKGREYLTSEVNGNNQVLVFTRYWISGVPVSIFEGERVFTEK